MGYYWRGMESAVGCHSTPPNTTNSAMLQCCHIAQVEQSIIAYSTAVRSCGNSSAWVVSLELFEEAVASGLPVDAMALNVLLTALSCGDQWAMALQMLHQSAGNADTIAYNATGLP